MGTTLTVTALRGDSPVLAHVGDTRAYVLRDQWLVPISRSHMLVEDIRGALALSPNEADTLGGRRIECHSS